MLSLFRRERGQDLVEYAVIMPVVLLLIFGIMQFALVMLTYNELSEAAREGTRLGVIGQNADDPDLIRSRVYLHTDTAGLDRAELTVTPTKTVDAATGELMIKVQVDYNLDMIIPIFSLNRIPLRAVSTKLIELE